MSSDFRLRACMSFSVFPGFSGWGAVLLVVLIPGKDLTVMCKRSLKLGERFCDLDECFGIAKCHRIAGANIASCVHRPGAWVREKALYLLTHDNPQYRGVLYDVTEND